MNERERKREKEKKRKRKWRENDRINKAIRDDDDDHCVIGYPS